MKKKRLPIDFDIPKFITLIFLAIASLFYLNGCTTKALQLAKEKASPENCKYLKIKSVVSAIKQKNGDISVCVELNDPAETDEPELNTITLPLSALTGETTDIEMFGVRPAECPFDDAACYWYPIEKAKNGCEKITPGSLFSTSALPIEKLEVHNKDLNQLFDLHNNFTGHQLITENIYEVTFVSDEKDTEKATDSDEAIDNRGKGFKDISLIYWPAQIGEQGINPIVIAGAYKDNSTDLYYLTVPPAFAGDVIVGSIAVFTFLLCPLCF